MLEPEDHTSMGVEKRQSAPPPKKKKLNTVYKAAGLLKKFRILHRDVRIDSWSNVGTLTKVLSNVTPCRLLYTITM